MRQKRLFYISGGGYLLSSISVLFMPLGDISGQNGSKAVAILCAVIFWLSLLGAIAAQNFLRYIQKPYRRQMTLLRSILSPPTFWTALAFVISLIATVILTIVNQNGFVLYFCIFLVLLSLEWTLLTSGKFRRKDGKLVLKRYKLKI